MPDLLARAEVLVDLRPYLVLSLLLLLYDLVLSKFSLHSLLLTMFLSTSLVWLWHLLKSRLRKSLGPSLKVLRVEWPRERSVCNSRLVRVYFTAERQIFRRRVNLSALLPRLSCELRVSSLFDAHHHYSTSVNINVGNEDECLELIFPSRQAGHYVLVLRMDNEVISGFPSHCDVHHMDADSSKSCLAHSNRTSILLLTSGCVESLSLVMKDKFGNLCSDTSDMAHRVSILVSPFQHKETNEVHEEQSRVNFVVFSDGPQHLTATLAFDKGREGWYNMAILLDQKAIDVGTRDRMLSLIVLTSKERMEVSKLLEPESNLFMPFSVSFDACLVDMEKNEEKRRSKKAVVCSMSSKQLVVKEYVLKIIPRRLHTFRLAPATRVLPLRRPDPSDLQLMSIDDGCQQSVVLSVKKANVMAAVYHSLLLRRVGGSESFEAKLSFFQRRLLQHHLGRGHQHSRLNVRIDRDDLLNASIDKLKWLSDIDWCRLFEIDFVGEPGLDTGGPRREWFELLCRSLFDPVQGYFVRVEEESEAVHPNPNPDSKVRAKVYKLAGKLLGKCLYEGAHGSGYRLHMPVRLAKSLLAQMVGMRVQYTHFRDDAPALYASKIAFIEDNSVNDLDLTFSHDHFDLRGRLVSTVDLKANGSKISVDEHNKLEYLDLLAQHLLSQRMLNQTQLMISGLHAIVPDSMLTMFDENELELMLCGSMEYDVDELQQNHVLIDANEHNRHLVQWFFMAVRNLSNDQMAKLMQFVTGSSHLPIGGFAQLKPNFQIVTKGRESRGQLPTAHTCFNMINLPYHDDYISFEKALITAITEGNEGFSMA